MFFFLSCQFPENAGGIRTIAPLTPGNSDGYIVIGTTRNHIMEGSLQTKFKYVLQVGSERKKKRKTERKIERNEREKERIERKKEKKERVERKK